MRRCCAARPRASARSSTTARSSICRSTAAASSRSPAWRPASPLPPGSPLPRINGGRPRTNEYLFDGISVLQPEPGQVAFFPNIDAIQEFKIESNSPPAEFGRFNGGVVNLTTKSGRNALHGTRVRVLPPRGAERAQLLRPDRSGQADVPPQPVRRRRRRTGPARPHVLLRRLPGPAPDDRPHGDLDRADGAAAPGHLHRSDRRPRAGRSTIRRRPSRPAAARRGRRFPATRFPSSASIRSRGRCSQRYPLPTSAGTANNYPPGRQRNASIRISSACASIIACSATAIRCSAG